MSESFDLIVEYKGQERVFGTILEQKGYTYRFSLTVDGAAIYFERDDEGAFRAILSAQEGVKEPEKELLRLIAEKLEEILA